MQRGHISFFAESIQNETIKGRCCREYLDPRGMDLCDSGIDIGGGRFYHSRNRPRIFVLAGLVFGILDFGGIAMGITLAIGWLAISLEFAFCGWVLSVRDTFNNFFKAGLTLREAY